MTGENERTDEVAASDLAGRTERATPAERLSRTRARLLDAVVETLVECGYSGTSTSEVARRSGLTRGAQLHHFGTKDQMVVAAVEHLGTRARAVDIASAVALLPSDGERLETAIALISRIFQGPFAAAYVELWVASRSHPELADALRDADVVARDQVRALFGAEILNRAGPEFDALLDVTLYAVRGMALDAHLASEAELRARVELILGLLPYFEQALRASADGSED